MKRRLYCGLFLGVALCGCGTMENLKGGDRAIYGGVRQDFQNVSSGKTGALLDVPFSVVGDTVTLPVTVGKALNTPR
jgi:uncharacterized protein YceK